MHLRVLRVFQSAFCLALVASVIFGVAATLISNKYLKALPPYDPTPYCTYHVMGSLFGDGGGNGAANGTGWQTPHSNWNFTNGQASVVDRFEACANVMKARGDVPSNATISRTNNTINLDNFTLNLPTDDIAPALAAANNYYAYRAFLMSVIEGEGSVGGQIADNSKCLNCGPTDTGPQHLNPDFYKHITTLKKITDRMWIKTHYSDGKAGGDTVFSEADLPNLGTVSLWAETSEKIKFQAMPFAARNRAPGGTTEVAKTTPPVPALSSPATGASLSGTVTVAGTVTDGTSPTGPWGHYVDFYIDGTKLGGTQIASYTATINSSYSQSLNTASYSNGTHTLKLTAIDYYGNSTSDTHTVTISNNVTPPPPTPASINTFTPSPASVTTNGSSTLAWTTSNTSGSTPCSIFKGAASLAASLGANASWLAPNLSATTTYTLKCNGASNTATRDATVTVTAPVHPPTITQFTANPSAVQKGRSTQLSWVVQNATNCDVNNGGPSATTATNWTTGNLNATTNYTLTCRNSAGTATANVTVNATEAPPVLDPVIYSFSADPVSLSAAGQTRLSWSIANVEACSLTPSPLTSINDNFTFTASTRSSTTYILQCVGNGKSVSKTVAVTVAGVVAPVAPPPVAPVAPPPAATVADPATGVTVGDASRPGSLQGLISLDLTLNSKAAAIDRVEYWLDEQLITTVTKAPYAYDVSSLKPGRYTFKEIVYYKDGSVQEKSSEIQIGDVEVIPETVAALSSRQKTEKRLERLVASMFLVGGLVFVISALVLAGWLFGIWQHLYARLRIYLDPLAQTLREHLHGQYHDPFK